MKRAPILIGAALLALSAGPANAQPEEEESPAAIEASRAAIAGIDLRQLVSDRAYAEQVLGHLDRLQRAATGNAGVPLAIDNIRLLALVTLERADEAKAIIDRSLALRPTEAGLYASLWYGALSLHDPLRALEVVEQASRSVPGVGWRELREMLERDPVFSLFQHFQSRNDKASRVRLAEALFRIGWPEPAAREVVDSIRLILLNHRLELGDRAAAADLAAGLTTPSNLAPLIVQRRFDDLFPAGVDRLARLRQALEVHDRHSAEALAAAPRDVDRALDRAQHLRILGRESEALAVLDPFTRDVPATVEGSSRGMWLVNEAAYALLELGRKEEAALLMRRLVALPIADHTDLIGPNINNIEILREAGQFAEALAFGQRVEREFSQYASGAGKMWIWSGIVCALAGLGRAAEAAPTLERMRAAGDDNPAALTRAYLCLNDMAAAEALMIRRLEREDDREAALMALQDYQLTAAAAGPDPLLDRLISLRERPAVRAALERVGRVVQLPMARTYWGGV